MVFSLCHTALPAACTPRTDPATSSRHLAGKFRTKLCIYAGAMQTPRSGFRMGRLDHVHIRVPDRAEAARWYAEHLGFEPVDRYDFWASGFEGGPLQISADGGRTMLALFEASEGHPMVPQKTGVAFSVDADTFMSFARSLPCELDNPSGERLVVTDLIDFECAGRSISSTPGETSTSSTATTTTG